MQTPELHESAGWTGDRVARMSREESFLRYYTLRKDAKDNANTDGCCEPDNREYGNSRR